MGKNRKQRILFFKIYLLGNEMYLFVFFGELELFAWVVVVAEKAWKNNKFFDLEEE